MQMNASRMSPAYEKSEEQFLQFASERSQLDEDKKYFCPHMQRESQSEPFDVEMGDHLEDMYFTDPRPLEPERMKTIRIQWARYI
ncbi:hypothetical protein HKD37_11G031796 [Glycine soja]